MSIFIAMITSNSMNRWKQQLAILLCLLSLLCFSQSAFSAEAIRFPLDQLEKFSTELFDYYPPTVCALRALLGPEYQQIQQNELDGGWIGQSDWDAISVDGRRGGVIDSSANYQNKDKRCCWVHPSGGIIVGIKRGTNRITFYTNDSSYKANPPPVMLAFARMAAEGSPQIVWKTPAQRGLAFPHQCEPSAVAAELKAYLTAQSGTSCRLSNMRNMRFGQNPYLVLPGKGADKAYLQKNLAAKPPADTKNVPYLVAGDLVQLATTDFKVKPSHGCACAYYHSANGKEAVGWVNQSYLMAVPESNFTSWDHALDTAGGAPGWFAKSVKRNNYPGRYKDDQKIQTPLSVARKGEKLTATLTLADDGDVDLDLKLAGKRVAVSDKNGDTPGVRLYLFNNGFYLYLETNLFHFNPSGIYYPH